MLVKLRLSLTVVFSSVMAFLIASPDGQISWFAVLMLAVGGFLVTGAANALNQVLEKDYDRLMRRTENRPLAAGRMKIAEAVLLAGLMSATGIILLAMFNPLTAVLGNLALLSYAFLYTPLKRVSPIAVLVGAIPGALPMLIGAVAAQGTVTTLALVLFTIQFFWQFPHFWSIAWLGHEDYTKAGYKLLPGGPSDHPTRATGLQSFWYALFLLPVGVIPFFMGFGGMTSLIILTLMNIVYAALGWNLFRKNDRSAALRLMFFSFLYIPVALIALFADKV
ncbi:MAG: protoheme IX farnesyltransferase [Lewinellaceae bacterium]|nr:protoheme IX farnesyltransferase [Lewinellaceae bacterium]